MNNIVYVGMDVHKDSFSLACYRYDSQTFSHEAKIDADCSEVLKYLSKLRKEFGKDAEFRCGYEAGCTGYVLQRYLSAKKIECVIMAPSSITKPATHARRKNDRLDARMIAKALCDGNYKPVHVPTEEDEEIKEYIRLRAFHKKELRKVKQALLACLLRNGYKYDIGKTNFTPMFFKWVTELPLKGLRRETIDEYVATIQRMSSKIESMDEKIMGLAVEGPHSDTVRAIACIPGITESSALSMAVEVSDFGRFTDARSFMCYLGMIPGDDSSGGHTRGLPMTKAGNSRVRMLLVECVQALLRTSDRKSKAIRARQKDMPAAVISYADKARDRIKGRNYHFFAKGKNKNVAIAACARELAGFVWGMANGCMN